MSNDITQSPIILDNANTTAVVISQLFEITKVIWQSGASGIAGDQLVLKDKNAKIKLDITLDASKQTKEISFHPDYPLQMAGLIFHTCSHGTVYIYTKEKAPFAS